LCVSGARIIINPAVEAEKMKRERRCTARRKKDAR
jgi:hypothetical protein